MFKIANTSMIEFNSFSDFNPDFVIRILDASANENFEWLNFEECQYNAKELRLRFDDVCSENNPFACNEDQASAIFDVLNEAIQEGKSVLVHCVMGKCRSGAVTHAGIAIAKSYGVPYFAQDNGAIPNSFVKSLILRRLYQY